MEQIEIITDGIEEKIEYKEIIKEVLDKCFKEEKLGKHITITVTLTNPENIRKIKTAMLFYYNFVQIVQTYLVLVYFDLFVFAEHQLLVLD